MNNLPIAVQVILWILFWYYLAPYYLLKNYIFTKSKRSAMWSSISSIVIVFILFGMWMNSLPSDTSESAGPQIHYVTKKVGSAELKQAKLKQKTLSQEEKKKQSEYTKLSSKLDEEKEQVKREEKQKTANENEAQKTRSDKSHHRYNGESQGDLDTAQTGQIIGNRNSKIYHVPGQAGYRMNSANAVYFNSEQDAINAGYRKAKR